jgi:Calx-beta domain-containing protein
MKPRISAPARALGVLLLLVAGFLVAPQVVSPARACATTHADFWLTAFTEGPSAPHFYMTPEDQTPRPFQVEGTIAGCTSTDPVHISWATADGTAEDDDDYQATSGTSPDLNDPPCSPDQHCPIGHVDDITIIDDGDQEQVAEHAQLTVSTPSGRVHGPAMVPVYIVDDDGPSRVAFAPVSTQQYAQQEHSTSARIPVFRAGDASVPMTVNYSLAGSGADPAEASDFSPASGQFTFGSGIRLAFLQFTVKNDALVENDETITATISAAASPSTAAFTIMDDNDNDLEAPVTRFNHPLHGRTYDDDDHRIREMETSSSDTGGSGVVKSWLALRRQLLNGQCAWYTGSGFASGGCGAKRWLPMELETPDVFVRGVRPLVPSIGTKVKNYRAWTKAQDGAGNTETTFTAGRNVSTFEVRRG